MHLFLHRALQKKGKYRAVKVVVSAKKGKYPVVHVVISAKSELRKHVENGRLLRKYGRRSMKYDMTSQTLWEARKYEETFGKTIPGEERPDFHLSTR